MADLPLGDIGTRRRKGPGWLTRLAMSPQFHRISQRIPGLRHLARAEGQALFEVVQGFVASQVLFALVELRLLHRLADGPLPLATLARSGGIPEPRLDVLLRAGAALRLVRQKAGLWHLTPRGGAFLTVPGLEAMVRHHDVLYRDLADPVAFFRGETRPGLADFWPYVFGAGAAEDPGLADRYSRLMADSQLLVAEDTLRLADFRGIAQLMDVGGGTGAFLAAVLAAHPGLHGLLFDLPAVVPGAEARLAPFGARARVFPGSFRDAALPAGADAISLVRVLYDHADSTVARLLAAVHAALPPGGQVIISEPMSGGARPDPGTDVYFSVYTMAMQTGRTRSAAEILRLLADAGFVGGVDRGSLRPYVTRVLTARRG